jgi:anti-sigma B factor antagonist
MNIKKAQNENQETFILSGTLDTLASPELEDEIALITDQITRVRLDLKDVDYVSSNGLRCFLLLQKLMDSRQGEFIISHPNQMVKDVLEMTGFATIMKIED